MYKQLTSEQRSQIFALLQKKTARKEIAKIVGTSESTLSRELKRNRTPSGNYLWFQAHAKAMERRKRTTVNARLDELLVWRIKEMIVNDQWSPRQISGVLGKEGIKVSHQSIYNIIHNDPTEIPAISSNIESVPNAGTSLSLTEQASTNDRWRRMENDSEILKWILSWIATSMPYSPLSNVPPIC